MSTVFSFIVPSLWGIFVWVVFWCFIEAFKLNRSHKDKNGTLEPFLSFTKNMLLEKRGDEYYIEPVD